MNIFWNLVSYEYKKIFKRKGAVITLILAAAVSLFSVFGTIIGYVYDSNGEPVMSRYDDMKIDREYARELSGRAIDTELIRKLPRRIQSYSLIPPKNIPTARNIKNTQENTAKYIL